MIDTDPAVFSKLLDKCFVPRWSLHPDIADMLNLYLSIEKQQVDHALREPTPVIPIRPVTGAGPADWTPRAPHLCDTTGGR